MKRACLKCLLILLTLGLFAQEVEKISILYEVKNIDYPAGLGGYPIGIYYNEVEDILITQNTFPETIVEINLKNKEIKEETRTVPHFELIKKVGNDYWGISGDTIHPVINNKSTPIIRNSSGISFILKKGEGYIVYYVDEIGIPGAVDTEGRIYSNKEAIEYLKEYDPEKYAESLARAEELGLKAEYERAGVLIWGQTYYSSFKELQSYWNPCGFISSSGLKQYDNQGYGYELDDGGKFGIDIICVDYDSKRSAIISDLQIYSEVVKAKQQRSISWYVGYGGNIYYYIAGEEYTEVFRIRRTWGRPDMYAMAVNGYTEDSYGEYVKTTLAGMSKAELRLLRNTIFALYGVHFKSEDLSKHFAKEVWYTDEGKTSADVTLPAHRQKLVEMIQAMERK